MSELDEIREDYLYALEELTGVQKPIITNLTVIAEENRHAAKAITRAIEERISKVSSGGTTMRRCRRQGRDQRTQSDLKTPVPATRYADSCSIKE
jgi:hypothetical protein